MLSLLTSSKRRGNTAAVEATFPAEETVPAAVQSTGEAVTATVVPAVGSVVEATVAAVVSTTVDLSIEEVAPTIDLSKDDTISPSSGNEIHREDIFFTTRGYEELKPRLNNNPWEEKDQLKSGHSILYSKVDKYQLSDRPFYRAFSDNSSQVKLNFADIITDRSQVNGISHIFVGARLYEERGTVLLFFIRYLELYNAWKASPKYPSAAITTVDSEIVNNLWMFDFYGNKKEFMSKFCNGSELYVLVRTIKDPMVQLAIIKQVDAILKDNLTKVYVGELESAFLVQSLKNSDSNDDDDGGGGGDDDPLKLIRAPSSRIKNLHTGRLLAETLKISSDGCKGKPTEPISKKNSDSLPSKPTTSSGKKNSSVEESMKSAKDLTNYTSGEIHRMNKQALTQLALSLGIYTSSELEQMTNKDIMEYILQERSFRGNSSAAGRKRSSGAHQELSEKYQRRSENTRSPVHRTTSFGRRDEQRSSSPVRRTTSFGRKDEQTVRQRSESSVIGTTSSSCIIPVTAPSNDDTRNDHIVSQLINLTTAISSSVNASTALSKSTSNVEEATKQRLAEAQEIIKQKDKEHQETFHRMLVAETKNSMLIEFSSKEKTTREEEREYINKVSNQVQNTPQLKILEKLLMKDVQKAAPTPTNTSSEPPILKSINSPPLIFTPTIQQPIINNQLPPPQYYQRDETSGYSKQPFVETFSPALQLNLVREESMEFQYDFQPQHQPPQTRPLQLQAPQRQFETQQLNKQVPQLNHQPRQFKEQELQQHHHQQLNSNLPDEQHFGHNNQPQSQQQYQRSQQQSHQHSQQQSQQFHQHQQSYLQYQPQYHPQQQSSSQYQPQYQPQYHQSQHHQQQPQRSQHPLQQPQPTMFQHQQSFGVQHHPPIVRSSEVQKSADKYACYCNDPRNRDGGTFCGACGGTLSIKLGCCGVILTGSFCTVCGTPKSF